MILAFLPHFMRSLSLQQTNLKMADLYAFCCINGYSRGDFDLADFI